MLNLRNLLQLRQLTSYTRQLDLSCVLSEVGILYPLRSLCLTDLYFMKVMKKDILAKSILG